MHWESKIYMSLERIHYNYLIIGKKYVDLTLFDNQIFSQLLDIVHPLSAFTDIKKCKVSTLQYADKKKVKLGRLRWNNESFALLNQNVQQYRDNDSFHFLCTIAEFPSVDSAYKRQETVDIYLMIENDMPFGRVKSGGDCGIFLSLREDIYENAGDVFVSQTMQQLCNLFDNHKVLFQKRKWWTNHGESGLQDVAAYRAVDKLTSGLYENWTELIID